MVLPCLVFAQITLTLPKNRMVFQRDSQNKAHVYIAGSFAVDANRVLARLWPLDNTGAYKFPNQAPEWHIIDGFVANGNFSGAIFDQPGGWYQLELQLLKDDYIVMTQASIKVGVGEVLLIAGQSNATGLVPLRDPTLYAPGDMVNCINAYGDGESIPDTLEYSHLQPGSDIYPIGETAWCWGVMGDQIAQNWQVPVLFYNAAKGNTSVFDWRGSARQEPGYCDSPTALCPYPNLKKSITQLAKKTGIRAILWHQGESDNGNFGTWTEPWIYQKNLALVIDSSRAQYGADLSWVIAKVSRTDNPYTPTNWRVTQGQQMVIDSVGFNCFLGPPSDDIQPSVAERDIGGVHFWGQGLIDLGTSWFSSMNNPNFISNSKPQKITYPISSFNTIKSGNWNEASTWSAGKIPSPTDQVLICSDHTITINSPGATAKNIDLRGQLLFENNAILTLSP